MNSNFTILKVNKLGLILMFIDDISFRDPQFYSEKWEFNYEELK